MTGHESLISFLRMRRARPLCDTTLEREIAAKHRAFDQVQALDVEVQELRASVAAWKKLFDDEATERERLEDVLRELWRLPPSAEYFHRVGEIARRSLERAGKTEIDPMCSYCEVRSSEHEEIYPWCREVGS